MIAKKTHISLSCEELGETRLFDIEHAERLLGMVNNGGWHIPEDSEFKLNENGKIIRRNKGDIQTSGGDQSNSESKGTRRKNSVSHTGENER